MSETLYDGRRVRLLTVIDEGNREGIVKLRLMAVSDAQYGGFTTGSSPVSWG